MDAYQSSMRRRRAERDGGDLCLPRAAVTSAVSVGTSSGGTRRFPFMSASWLILWASSTASADTPGGGVLLERLGGTELGGVFGG